MNPAQDTRERILNAAEALFADHGFAATSLRAITARAEANLAAVHYHFGSKEALWQAVFERRIAPINRARIEGLDALERAQTEPTLEEVLEVFLAPALRLVRDPDGPTFMRLAGRTYTEPGAHWQPVVSQFEEVRDRLLAALARATPQLPPATLAWRVHFMIGVMCHTLADVHRLCLLGDSVGDTRDPEVILDHLVPYLAAGFRAPVRTKTATEPGR